MVHENSMAVWAESRANLDRRCSEVLGAILRMGSCTDRQVKEFLGYEEMNSVRPRITELKKLGLVREVGKRICSTTGKRVRVVSVNAVSESANTRSDEAKSVETADASHPMSQPMLFSDDAEGVYMDVAGR